MNKCYNCGYCQEHCQCERECEKCELMEEDIDITENEPGEPKFIEECGGDMEDIEEWEPEPIEEDKDDIIFCHE